MGAVPHRPRGVRGRAGQAAVSRAATLADAWQQRAAEPPPSRPVPPAVQARRDFYAGALAAAQLPRDQVLRECMDFALSIGREPTRN